MEKVRGAAKDSNTTVDALLDSLKDRAVDELVPLIVEAANEKAKEIEVAVIHYLGNNCGFNEPTLDLVNEAFEAAQIAGNAQLDHVLRDFMDDGKLNDSVPETPAEPTPQPEPAADETAGS
jgi:hypothetical protein